MLALVATRSSVSGGGRQRRGRHGNRVASRRGIEDAAYRAPIADQRRHRAERTTAAFRTGEHAKRVALATDRPPGFRHGRRSRAGGRQRRRDGRDRPARRQRLKPPRRAMPPPRRSHRVRTPRRSCRDDGRGGGRAHGRRHRGRADACRRWQDGHTSHYPPRHRPRPGRATTPAALPAPFAATSLLTTTRSIAPLSSPGTMTGAVGYRAMAYTEARKDAVYAALIDYWRRSRRHRERPDAITGRGSCASCGCGSGA